MGVASPGVTLPRCDDPGFTPGRRDVPALLELWARCAERDDAKRVVAALMRGEQGVAAVLLRGLAQAPGAERAMRLRVLTRIAQRLPLPELAELLPAALRDDEPRVVREAARAIGKLELPEAEALEPALLEVADQAAPPERRAAVEALGRIGGALTQQRLARRPDDDDDLRRRIAEATTLVRRRHGREHEAAIRLDRALPRPLELRLRGRGGTAEILAQQAAARLSIDADQIQRRGDDAVLVPWSGPLGEALAARSALDLALGLPLPPGSELVDRIVAGLRAPALVEALAAWTDGPLRFRLAFADGGHRRSLRWQVAVRLAERPSPLVNDTREVAWTIEVDERAGRLWCLPRGADPRFEYRRADVPAASHPTMAALLAWLGRPRAGEVVWDPFCGSGLELVEASILAPGLHLLGTDLDPRALEIARTNLAAAPIEPASLELHRIDARRFDPARLGRRVSLILTNPPMGRRVVVEHGLHRLLVDLVGHAARVLAPGGRLVWLSPAARATAEAGRARGLRVEELPVVDMGGLRVTPQLLHRPR
ncbi:MAG: HEAT repeat domain-containing protein [Myxococcales bacterium]|nr:HEAT repeat domain-containing protein [Myxococcales bacterium]